MTEPDHPVIAYMMSRFPKITETFILTEMIAVEAEGIDVEVYPLLREDTSVIHAEAQPYVDRAHFEPFMSFGIFKANMAAILRQPLAYLSTFFGAVWGVRSSRNFVIGTLGIFPKAVKMALDMQRDDVTHIHAHFANHPAMAAMIIHRLTGIPYSFTGHGSDLHVDQTYLSEKLHRAAFAVTISRYNVDFMCEHAGEWARHKIKMIHCGIDTAMFQPAPSQDTAQPFTILMVAALREVKGHSVLMAACEHLKEKGLDFRCHLIGDGELRKDIQTYIDARGLTGQVSLLGPQPRDVVATAMKEADVIVLPSIMGSRGDREGIPVVLMEAMATGKPVVSTQQSGIPELVEDGVSGFLCPAGDAEALAEALITLAEDAELRNTMGKAGRSYVEQHFNIRETSRQMAQVLKEAAA